MKVDAFINKNNVSKYFILDSHDKGTSGQSGTVFKDEDYVQYSYEPSKNDKLVPGTAFLYRKPGRNFRFTGGGYISAISEEDSEGYKTASITNGFSFINPLQKGDPFLENFHWQNKEKPGIGWKGFFANYGMLRIEAEDFWGLVSQLECKPGIPSSELAKDEVEEFELLSDVGSEKADLSPAHIVNNTPISRPDPVTTKGKVYPRDRTVARNALRNANHICEYNTAHPLFLRRGTNINYCEPHHLVPMGYQEGFDNSLDREENVICLCSNCHNQIHYGEGAKEIITKLYSDRKDDLKRVGIDINIDTLLSMYGLS